MPKRSSIGQEADTKFRQHAPTSPQATRVHKNDAHTSRSEGDHDTLALLVATKLELLCSANALLLPCLALGALHTDRHLLRGLGLWVVQGVSARLAYVQEYTRRRRHPKMSATMFSSDIPSCGKPALSAHRTRTAYGRTAACLLKKWQVRDTMSTLERQSR